MFGQRFPDFLKLTLTQETTTVAVFFCIPPVPLGVITRKTSLSPYIRRLFCGDRVSDTQITKLCMKIANGGSLAMHSITGIVSDENLETAESYVPEIRRIIKTIGHFRVPKSFTFKTRLSAKPLLWK